MEPVHSERRREPRFLIAAGASIEVNKNGLMARAITVDMSERGILIRLLESLPLAVGDEVTCEFKLPPHEDQPLPYWGVGRVVHRECDHVGIELQAAGFSASRAQPDTAQAP